MSSLFDLMERVGLATVAQSKVVVPNFELPVLMSNELDAPAQTQPLFCRETGAQSPQATLLYFTFPECENCRPGMKAFEKLAREFNAVSPAICFRAVVTDWQTQPEIAQELQAVGWRNEVGLVWDPLGVLQERLAVLAQPAFFILDRGGQVVAYSNGPVEFAAPGFEVFWTTFSEMIISEAKKPASDKIWSQTLLHEPLIKSSRVVTFLNNGVLSGIWLVVAIALCYSFIRFFARLRKNFRRSQNSS